MLTDKGLIKVGLVYTYSYETNQKAYNAKLPAQQLLVVRLAISILSLKGLEPLSL